MATSASHMPMAATYFTVIGERIPKTLAVTVSAFILSLLIGVPVGILAAVRRESAVDKGVMAGAVLGYSIPNFLLGLIFIFVFRRLASGTAEFRQFDLVPCDPANCDLCPLQCCRRRALHALDTDRCTWATLHRGCTRRRHPELGDHPPSRASECGDSDGDHARLHRRGPTRRLRAYRTCLRLAGYWKWLRELPRAPATSLSYRQQSCCSPSSWLRST